MANQAAMDHIVGYNYQDCGGALDEMEAPMEKVIEASKKPVKYWEYQCHALSCLLVGGGKVRPGEMRRAIEFLPTKTLKHKTYYEKWASAIAQTAIERGTITQTELDATLGLPTEEPAVMFKDGDYARVKIENSAVRYRKPHLRTPGYLFGVIGKINGDSLGYIEEPDIDAFHYVDGPRVPVYRVTFHQADLWEGYNGLPGDTLEIEVFQPWLQSATAADYEAQVKSRNPLGSATDPHHPKESHGHLSHADHTHPGHHGHDHEHEERTKVEQNAVDAEKGDEERGRLTQALVKLMIEKKVITAEQMRAMIEELDTYGSRGLGPRIVARAWVDPAFKARLLKDGNSAAAELGMEADGWPANGGVTEANPQLSGMILKVVENTPTLWHLLVCTLCSCYPISILGMAPSWYKSRAYRALSVRDPRGTLAGWGTTIPKDMNILVMDSNADTRFICIPMRPAGTEKWTEEQLQSCVTRDSMVGVAHPKSAEQVEKEGFQKPYTAGYKGSFIYQ